MTTLSRSGQIDAVTLSGAAAGLAAGAVAASFFKLPAESNQLVGLAKLKGFNPREPVVAFAMVCVGSLAGAALARAVWRRREQAIRPILSWLFLHSFWLKLALVLGAGLAALAALARGPLRMPSLVAWAAAISLGAAVPMARGAASPRRLGLATAAAHALLLWTFLAAPAARIGLPPLPLAGFALALSIFEGHRLGGRDLEKGAPPLAVAVLVFPVAFWPGRTETACWLAALATVLLPALVRPVADRSRVSAGLRALTVVVLLPGCFVVLGAASCLRSPPVGDFFEDGHSLLPASEYLRGERPYQDILPWHGLISDGVLQLAEMKALGEDYRGVTRGFRLAGAFFWPSFYALGAAAAGSPALGFWGLLLSFLAFPQYAFFRVIAPFFSLALSVRAARTGGRGAWFVAGAALPIAMLFALEFTFYSLAASLAALLVSRGDRAVGARRFAAGVLISSGAVATLFAVFGFLRAFLYSSFVFIPGLWSAYALGAPAVPPSILHPLQWLRTPASLLDPAALYVWFLLAALLVTAALLARAPAVGMRGRAALPLLVWFCAATLSVFERHHFGYALFVLPVAVLLLARWVKGYASWRTVRGAVAVSVLCITVLAFRPRDLAGGVVYGLANVSPPDGARTLADPPRARGAFFRKDDAAAIDATGEFLKSGLMGPDDTWLDFANAPILYFLFERDCPVRYQEVTQYESREVQEELIGTVAGNPRIRAVLLRTGRPTDWVDGIPNSLRAPLVFDYISRSFAPAYSKNGVEFWLRRP